VAPERAPAPRDPFAEAPRRSVKRGSRVRHPTLGQGVVLELEGEGEETKLVVFFERAGKRKLIARFANLELL
jgi:DNA helicase-2/ATP-dependent DNA helicase PcrA